LKVGDVFRHEGVLGTVFTGRVLEETSIGHYRAIVPEISGRAWITGFAHYVVDAEDPFPDGFKVGDIWGDTL
jgi:proline racemase